MATNRTQDSGIIILGNAGTGKSYLCNMLISEEMTRFESEFASSAVTTKTEHQRITVGGLNLRIYNIPGLIEAQQEGIERNKREIMKAFYECPNSIVLFVWGHVGGRVQKDDIIAFKALNEAYQFPQGSLAFVVNNLKPARKAAYDGEFMRDVKTLLAPLQYPTSDFIFIDEVDPDKEESKEKLSQSRLQLFNLIKSHKPAEQKKHKDIDLEEKKIKELRELLEKQREASERDQKVAQKALDNVLAELKKVKEDERKQRQELQNRLTEMEDQRQKALRKEVQTLREELKGEKNQNETMRNQIVQERVQGLEQKLVEKEEQLNKKPDVFGVARDVYTMVSSAWS